MATIMTHAAASILVGKTITNEKASARTWFYVGLVSLLPDSDVFGFFFGIKYGDFLGHRGFTHSILFAVFIGLIAASIKLKRCDIKSKSWINWATIFFVSSFSHGVFDAMTNGGLGIAFFSPFDLTRYFFPWTPIEVSPIGPKGFFSQRGLDIMISEFKWILSPLVLIYILRIKLPYFNKQH